MKAGSRLTRTLDFEKNVEFGFGEGLVNQAVQLIPHPMWADMTWCMAKRALPIYTTGSLAPQRKRLARRTTLIAQPVSHTLDASGIKDQALHCLGPMHDKFYIPAPFVPTSKDCEIVALRGFANKKM